MKTLHALIFGTGLCGLLSLVDHARAQNWVQTGAPITNWSSLACSAVGTKIVAAVYGGPIYISTNSGATWSLTGAPSDLSSSLWSAVASSADGRTLVAGNYGVYDGLGQGAIYASTNAGAAWLGGQNSAGFWESVASSAPGDKLVAAASARTDVGGPRALISTSTNSGATWTSNNVPGAYEPYWQSVASSADGTRLVAAASGLPIYTSADAGTTWIASSSPAEYWSSVASSADGRRLVASSTYAAGIYISTNSGAAWGLTSAPSNNWVSVASSADGTKLAAAANGASIYTSPDSGATWIATSAPVTNWAAIASSADGARLFAANGGGVRGHADFAGLIYTSQTIPTPTLTIAPSGNELLLSWIVPSVNFVLQQSSDLTTTNWTDLTAPPKLNFTNLQYEIPVSGTNASRFYRLRASMN